MHDTILKFDILGHDDPTMLKHLRDLTGIDPMTIPNVDKRVLSLFSSLTELNVKEEDLLNVKVGSLGIPEFNTTFTQGVLEETKPSSFADLIRISGLTHGTDV
jgi:DNA polymerase-3 subunit alpha (Gram-positive type)